ncbi:MAG: ABC transporter permease [Thermoprotei archaeon]
MREEKQNLSPLHGMWALIKRELKKWYTVPVVLFISLFQPIIWLVLFGKSMNMSSFFTGTSINIPGLNIPKQIIDQISTQILQAQFGTTDYFSFLAAGMLSFIVLFTAMGSGMTIVWDRRLGFLNRLLTTPIPRSSIVISKVASSVIRSLVQATIVLLVAALLGMEFKSGITILDIIGVYAALFLMAFGLASLFITLAIRSSSWESQMAIMNLLNLPLLFASNAFYPTKSMPSWLQPIAEINPLTYTNDAVRQLLIGTTGSHALWFDYLYLTIFTLIFAIIGTILSWKYLSGS